MVWFLVQTEDGHAGEIAATVGGFPGVEVAAEVTGSYDVIVRVPEPASASEVDSGTRVLRAVQRLPGVTRTVTLRVPAQRADRELATLGG